MKVFMLGWEFPPLLTGGLGTACYGLTQALEQLGAEILFVLPKPLNGHVPGEQSAQTSETGGSVESAHEPHPSSHVRFQMVESSLEPYHRPEPAGNEEAPEAGNTVEVSFPEHGVTITGLLIPPAGPYGGDLFAEVERYTEMVLQIARKEAFDVIHAHDWMTFPAGLAVARETGKPLVVHVHSTELDRNGGQLDQRIFEIERDGVHNADRIIAVSYMTRSVLLTRYEADARHIHVIYNAIDARRGPRHEVPITRNERIVLYLGRITMQKGPQYFLAAAKKVIQIVDNVRFVMAGGGDMVHQTMTMARDLGIADKVLFTGFLCREDVARLFCLADVYVMPSVSEPFGIAPLEALSHDVPVIISRQSGVAEVLHHALKVDFWDVDELANKIVAVLRHPPLGMTLRDHGSVEVQKFSWQDSAGKCMDIYHELVGWVGRSC
jgi:glycogen synthase